MIEYSIEVPVLVCCLYLLAKYQVVVPSLTVPSQCVNRRSPGSKAATNSSLTATNDGGAEIITKLPPSAVLIPSADGLNCQIVDVLPFRNTASISLSKVYWLSLSTELAAFEASIQSP
ncbi:hypothetical protein D3C84_849450 [compost metagenome]